MVGVSEETVTVTLPLELAREFADKWGVRPGDGPVVRTACAVLAALPKPKPEEPTGLGARVVDAHGLRWVLTDHGRTAKWFCIEPCTGSLWRNWSELDVPDESHILSRGWSE